MSNRKPAKTVEQDGKLVDYRHPLAREYKRGKVKKEVVRSVVPTRNSAALGEIWENLMGAGYLAISLKLLFFADTPDMIGLRRELQKRGFRHRPKPVHVDAFALIEKAYPQVIGKADLAAELGIEEEQAATIITYLKQFIADMYGISVLPDWEGNVGIASPELWLTWQNRMAKTEAGYKKARDRHGYNKENVQNLQLVVAEKFSKSQPALLEFPQAASHE